MVSRYRDIIETNQSNLSRQTSIISTTPSTRNGMNDSVLIVLIDLFLVGSTSETNTDAASVNGLTSISTPITNNGV
jgi:hypothetical protein